jgi:site-specific recombinase XerD
LKKALRKQGLRDSDSMTFATPLLPASLKNGIDPYSIQKLMGHSSFSTTQRYAHHFVESFGEG